MLCERVEQQMSPSHEGAATGKTETVNHIGQKRGSEKFKKKQSQQTSKLEQRCYRCGNTGHFGKDSSCPARGKKCHKCDGKDNFSKMCKSKKQTVNNVTEQAEYAFVVKDGSAQDSLDMCLGGVHLNMLIDSGATCNVVDEGTWEKLKKQKIQCQSYAGSERKLYPYSSNQPLPVKGAVKMSPSAHSTQGCGQLDWRAKQGKNTRATPKKSEVLFTSKKIETQQ